MTTKAKGTSVRQKLINLSVDLGVPYQNLETAFILERLVARLIADKELHQHLVFKGGFVGLKVYDSARYTVDVDALVVKANVDSILKRSRHAAETDLGDGVWFRFEEQMDLATQGEYGGIRQTYRAGIGEVLKDLKKAQVVHFDVGIAVPPRLRAGRVGCSRAMRSACRRRGRTRCSLPGRSLGSSRC